MCYEESDNSDILNEIRYFSAALPSSVPLNNVIIFIARVPAAVGQQVTAPLSSLE